MLLNQRDHKSNPVAWSDHLKHRMKHITHLTDIYNLYSVDISLCRGSFVAFVFAVVGNLFLFLMLCLVNVALLIVYVMLIMN